MNEPRYFTPELERCLIRMAKSGDRKARDKLLLAAMPFVRRALQRLYPSVDEQDFEDLVHEAIPALIKSIERYDPEHPACARLYVFAAGEIHHAVARFYRNQEHLSYTDTVPEVAVSDGLDDQLESEQQTELARAALETLTPEDRDILISRHARDRRVSRRELAEKYRCAPYVVEYAERRAIQRFLKALASVDQRRPSPSVH